MPSYADVVAWMVSTTSPSLGLSEDPGSGSSGLGRGIGARPTPCRHVLPHALSPQAPSAPPYFKNCLCQGGLKGPRMLAWISLQQ